MTIHGRLNQRTWETDDGQRRSKLEVIADDIDFSGGVRSDSAPSGVSEQDYYDEDCPF